MPTTTPLENDELTPRAVVQALDRHIVGQGEAKRIVAIAIRNRARRARLAEEMAEEVNPKNIIMIGPTGVGKTEIARRLAKLVNAPFLKVEATKYTEVGYVGRDVESMVRDLVETSVKMVREREMESVRAEAEKRARERIIDALMGKSGEAGPRRRIIAGFGESGAASVEDPALGGLSRAEIERKFDRGEYDAMEIEIEVQARGGMEAMSGVIGIDATQMGDLNELFEKIMPQKSKKAKVAVGEAKKLMVGQAIDEMLDMEKVKREGAQRAEQAGIIFIDELDKVAGRGGGTGPDVSRQGVQRDLLPIVEGSTVNTKHGLVRTNHILFIAAGAFHESKPSDLMPELQGRFPLRVELASLTAEDFERILTEPDFSLIDQYVALLGTDGVILKFEPEAIREIALSAATMNQRSEDIGARRLHTILERVLQEISFDAPDAARGEIVVDRAYVQARLEPLMKDEDLSKFIL